MRRIFKCLVCILFPVVIAYGTASMIPGASAQRGSAARAGLQRRIDFKRQIEPIFARNCYQCHGANKAMGQLRLDGKESALKGGLSGAAIIPGDSKQSLLLKRILGEGNEARMPMGGAPLTPTQIALIRRWIDEGAGWTEDGQSAIPGPQSAIKRHWAYVKPVRPAAPRVKNQSWVRNPIDAFILARLEKEGLRLSPEADKATLLRRVYLDVIGLPPGVKEVDEFLADTSPEAYEKAVDRLLASERYGERWARHWLDLARYADSNGYEKDNLRVAWKYRDWVINALNKDMPFDQFTVEQIAGDMAPNATIDQKIASGFHRNTMLNQEGGIDPEENRFETLIDRVNTTATVWLGSTVACAQCHNHKYDPFSQKDYYRLMAFFDNAEYQIAGGGSERSVVEPQISLPTPEQEERRRALDAEFKQIETRLNTRTPELDAEQAKWDRDMLDEQNKWITLDPIKLESTGGATLKKLDDKSVLVSGVAPERDVYVVTAKADLKNITAVRVEAMTDASLPKGGPGRDPYGNFLLTGIEAEVASTPPAQSDAGPRGINFKNAFVDDQAYGINTRALFGKEPGDVATDTPSGWFVNATNDQAERLPRQGVFVAEKPFDADSGATLTIRLKYLGGSLNQAMGRFRLSVTTTDEPRRIVGVPARLRPILSIPPSERSQSQKEGLYAQFRAASTLLKADRDRLGKLRDEMRALNITTALVMQERPGFERPSTFFHERGSFLNKGEKVFAATPATLPPMPESAPINRLGLARWLVDENNPLTARVTVNRFWEQIFGRGLVETSEDFGTQGERPSHPELLDWLAVEFMDPTWRAGERESGGQGDKTNPQSAVRNPQSDSPQSSTRSPQSAGWSMKSLVRLIVTSSTYRQSSATTPALLEKDPYNRLLGRGPRFRMEAEMIRDVTLAASGLLSRKLGGPSVFPLQPEGVWKSPYSSEKWTVSNGEDRFRRSLYTFVRRSSPHPAMMTFDATSREYCAVRRVRTNTPLQALTTLNDEAAMEAARALAKRMIEEGGGDPRTRIVYGFRVCLTRTPNEKEVERLTALYQQQLSNFAANVAEAGKIASNHSTPATAAEFAAWTMVSNVLLNLDETLTKE
jgi:uncharacterized protein DUF1549/uncharacterized protein DUF1553/cytochrome c